MYSRGGTFEQFRKDQDELKHLPKKLRRFYEAQNELLDSFAEVDEILDDCIQTADKGSGRDLESAPLLPKGHLEGKEEAFSRTVTTAINVNLVINIVLLAAKIFVCQSDKGVISAH